MILGVSSRPSLLPPLPPQILINVRACNTLIPSCPGYALGQPALVLESPRRPCALKSPLRTPTAFRRAAGKEGGVIADGPCPPLAAGLGPASGVLLQSRSDGFTVCHLLRQAALLVPERGVGSRLQQQLHNIQKLAGGS